MVTIEALVDSIRGHARRTDAIEDVVRLADICVELETLRRVEEMGSDFGVGSRYSHPPLPPEERANVDALVPVLAARARRLGVLVDDFDALRDLDDAKELHAVSNG